jgi:hypothetical protein
MGSAYLSLIWRRFPFQRTGLLSSTESGHTASSFQVIGSGSIAIESSWIAGSGYTAQGTIAAGMVRFAWNCNGTSAN